MDLEEARLLFGYNRWANHRALEGAEALTGEHFSREGGGLSGPRAPPSLSPPRSPPPR